MNTLRRHASRATHVIFGTANDDSQGDQMRVTVIANGLSPMGRRVQPPTAAEPLGVNEVRSPWPTGEGKTAPGTRC
jgi:cell division GTPase FtsZ